MTQTAILALWLAVLLFVTLPAAVVYAREIRRNGEQ